MLVTFISQCEKKALKRTRRVLDAFAQRIGDCTWQTIITEDGLLMVKKLLRQTASKSTAVACHWRRSRMRSELVWIVGNRKQFNTEGLVPVNRTKLNLNHRSWENGWYLTEVIAIASAIAGIFHDFGKANDLFQDKLDPEIKGKKIFEPYRHEWVSLRLFQSFVGAANANDEEWLNKLSTVNQEVEEQVLSNLMIDSGELDNFDNPFEQLPEFAKIVSWLIVSHHRLPVYSYKGENEPSYTNVNQWLSNDFDSFWNSVNSNNDEWNEQTRTANWKFSRGTPLVSKTWQQKAVQLSRRALSCLDLIRGKDWLNNTFMMHISRLVLMLSDHCYSALDITIDWQDKNYQAYANTDKQKQLKQKLDEHNIGVAHNAYQFAKLLSRFRDELAIVSDDKKVLLKGVDSDKEFHWQETAFKIARSFQKDTQTQGFFGINMASTGKGKTIANARIMYALSDEQEGCRFSIALGLRTLTLQTGKMLQKKMELDDEEIAILIGSQAIQRLNQIEQVKSEDNDQFIMRGSESLDIGIDDDGYDVIYDMVNHKGLLEKWFKNNPKAQKLLDAPILVSTIDHLTPATEGCRGGRQIVPMLRLLTADLILDEPDEFDLNDLPALARLVNWAGMLGSKVLLSTATMPPALAYALFEAYQEGRKSFNAAINQHETPKSIICAWFDEFNSEISTQQDIQNFIKSHDDFVKRRIINLNQQALILRKAKLVEIPEVKNNLYVQCMSNVIQNNIFFLHSEHHQIHESGKKISIGLIRMANINPLIAVARHLYESNVPEGFRIHYCVYHSQYPLAQRALIESKLDQVLNRKDSKAIWKSPEINQAINNCKEQNQLFVVLATSVAEVGRDHDYDWAIAEPSSMRSIIQLAGRIQRHRKQIPKTENFYILAKNFRALKGKKITFCKPGFESKNRRLANPDLYSILEANQYIYPNSIPSIQLQGNIKKMPFTNLVTMEHMAYREKLLGDNQQKNNARLWWEKNVTWCAEIQRRQPFRAFSPDQAYCLYMDEDSEKPIWKIKNENVCPIEYAEVSDISTINLSITSGNQSWFETNCEINYEELARRFEMSLANISYCFGEVRLPKYENQIINWYYSPLLGVFKEI